MRWLDFSDQTIGMRILAAAVVLLVLAVAAVVTIIFAMLLVLFSADGSGGKHVSETLLGRAAWAIGLSMVFTVFAPPVLVLCKATPVVSLLPTGLGFLVTAAVTIWIVMINLGTG